MRNLFDERGKKTLVENNLVSGVQKNISCPYTRIAFGQEMSAQIRQPKIIDDWKISKKRHASHYGKIIIVPCSGETRVLKGKPSWMKCTEKQWFRTSPITKYNRNSKDELVSVDTESGHTYLVGTKYDKEKWKPSSAGFETILENGQTLVFPPPQPQAPQPTVPMAQPLNEPISNQPVQPTALNSPLLVQQLNEPSKSVAAHQWTEGTSLVQLPESENETMEIIVDGSFASKDD